MRRIEARHLARTAVIYIRRACGRERPEDSLQRDLALEFGWQPDAVHVLSDIGVGGFAADRPRYRRILELVQSRQAGAVLVSDLSRLGRSFSAVSEFVELLIVHDVPLIVDGSVQAQESAEKWG